MSAFIETRNSLQCRSHHQKFYEKFKSTKNIILFYREEFEKFNYKEVFQYFQKKEINVEQLQEKYDKNNGKNNTEKVNQLSEMVPQSQGVWMVYPNTFFMPTWPAPNQPYGLKNFYLYWWLLSFDNLELSF